MSDLTFQLQERGKNSISVTIRSDQTVEELANAFLAANGDTETDINHLHLVLTGRKLLKTARLDSINYKPGSMIHILKIKSKTRTEPAPEESPVRQISTAAPPLAPMAPTSTAAEQAEARANLIAMGFSSELVSGALAMAEGNPDVAYNYLQREADEPEPATSGRRQVELTRDDLANIFSELQVEPETLAVLNSILQQPSDLTGLLNIMDPALREEFLRRVEAYVARTATADAEEAGASAGPSRATTESASTENPATQIDQKVVDNLASMLGVDTERALTLIMEFGSVESVIESYFGEQ